jgi:hypothetical protein
MCKKTKRKTNEIIVKERCSKKYLERYLAPYRQFP